MEKIDNDTGEILFAPFLRSGGPNYDVQAVSVETGLACLDPTKTQQHEAFDADINNIVAKYIKTGVLPVSASMPSFEDFGDPLDYQTALNAVMAAEEAFMGLDASVRDYFDNDPGQLLSFCADPANEAEARRLGIIGDGKTYLDQRALESTGGAGVTPPASIAAGPVPAEKAA